MTSERWCLRVLTEGVGDLYARYDGMWSVWSRPENATTWPSEEEAAEAAARAPDRIMYDARVEPYG